MTRRALGWLLLCVAAAACRHRDAEELETQAAVPVETATPRVGAITAYVHASGVVDAAPGADWTAAAPQPARIAAVRAAPGDLVRKGTALVSFDAPQLRADLATRTGELAQAEARLENARRNHDRLTQLLDKGIASRKELEEAQKERLDAEAAVRGSTQAQAAAADLSGQATAVVPFDGIVAQRWHQPGDQVDAHEHVLRVVDPLRLEITAAVPAAEATRVVRGRKAQVHVSGAPAGTSLEASVVSEPAIVDVATGTVSVRLTLGAKVPLGTPVEVEIVAGERAGVLIVPATAVVREAGQAAVYVVDDSHHAHRQAVTLGLENGQEVEVASGLQAGDSVVVKGVEALPDGALVSAGSGKGE